MPIILPAPDGFSAADLVFEDRFSGTSLNASNWNTYVTSAPAKGTPWNARPNGGSGLGAQHNAEYFMPSQVSVNDGLFLTAVKRAIGGKPAAVPYTSGVVSSYGGLDFIGGYLQVSMKAPAGNGSWPALWMLPGRGATGGDDFEIDIEEGGFKHGSANPNRVYAWHLHTPSGVVGDEIDTGVDLTADRHTYGIDWIPGNSITWYLDGKQMAQVTSARIPIPKESMHLLMNQSVGNSTTSSWRTSSDASTPHSMTMQVDDVQLYQHPGLGEHAAGFNVKR